LRNENRPLPIIEVFPNPEALTQAAAERITDLLLQTLQEKQRATLVLTGGKTPKPVYGLLATAPYSTRIDWKRVHFFWGDERCVPPESPESNFGMAREALISKIDPPPANVHRMRGELDAQKAADLYEQEILGIFPGTGIPSFDLVLLGMGADGHTASLFPGTQWDEKKFVIANRIPQSGAKRVSMTPLILNAAAKTVFLVAGRNKATALACVLEDSACDYPAARIRASQGRLVWMVDSSAASLLVRN
jgi:6-phosphogluconolactonase